MKGILAQAKKNDGNLTYTNSSQDLFGKCRIMAEITNESFAFIYAHNGFFLRQPDHQSCKSAESCRCASSIGELVADSVDCRVGDTAITEKRKGWFAAVAEDLRHKRYPEAAEKTERGALVISAKAPE
ncbi:hypothetical protein [Ensifer aridi]|uniref:hypothetical protein n=1 Tax=Ensifer aridi TaxID=1708715 RepID=UPI000A11A4DB|nr:hypothetical protein [Ensifer aridi]